MNPTDQYLEGLNIFGPLGPADEEKFDKRFAEITGSG